MASHADHIFLCWRARSSNIIAVIFMVMFCVGNITGSQCTDGNRTCEVTTQLCNETSNTPGFVCTCNNQGQQLPPRNICIPIPENQKIYVSTVLNTSLSVVRWPDLNTPDKLREVILTNYPPDEVLDLVSGAFIEAAPLPGTLNLGKIKLLYALIFSENVTTRIKESLARRVLKLEKLQVVTVRGENISIVDYIGIFDTEQQLKNTNATNDAIDWCSSSSLFSCRNHSTCFDGGLRYTCPCKVGYSDSDNECHLAVRLANSSEPLAGRLENLTGGEWRTVCQLDFTALNAAVTCRQLGLPSRGAVYYENAVYGEGTGNISMYRMNCTGRELALSQCPSDPLPPGSCNHSMDVSIGCDTVCMDDYHFGINCSQPCVCNVSNTDLCDRDNGTCYCKAGWEGVTCDDDVDECVQTGACRGALERCQNTEGSFLCLCEPLAKRNSVGVCTEESSFEPSSSVRVILTAVLCSAAGAALVVVVVIICRVIGKRRARTNLGAGKAELDGYDNPRHSGGHEDLEVYDEITDKVELSEVGTSDGYTRPDSVTVENLRLSKELLTGTEDSNHGYLTVTGDLTRPKTADFRSDRPELLLRIITGIDAGDVSDSNGQVSPHYDGYLHPIALESHKTGKSLPALPDDNYLHPIASESDKAGQSPPDDNYLHPIASESDKAGQSLPDDCYLHAIAPESDKAGQSLPALPDDSYLHPIASESDKAGQSLPDDCYLHSIVPESDKTEQLPPNDCYLHPIASESDKAGQWLPDNGYLHPIVPESAKTEQLPPNDYYLHPVAKESDKIGQVLYSDGQSLMSEQDSGAYLQPVSYSTLQPFTTPADYNDDDVYLHPHELQNQNWKLRQQMTTEAEDIVSHSDLIE